MREQLDALVSELRRLRRDGVSRVVVSEESVAALRRLAASVATPGASPPASPVPAPTPAVSEAPAPRGESPSVAIAHEPVPVRAAPEPVAPPVVKPVCVSRKGPGAPPMPAPPVIELPAGSAQERLDFLLRRWLADPAAQARLAPGRHPVAFDGAPDAPVLFLIHMPGAEDGPEGRVLAGVEGELYGRIVSAMGLSRAKVCTVSLLPYRPELPGGYDHREPLPDEVAYFLPYLRALVATVNPRVIVALGAGARDALLGKGEPISKSRGQWGAFEGVAVMPTYHISYLTRNNTNKSKRVVWEDMLAVMERLGLPVSEKQRGYFL